MGEMVNREIIEKTFLYVIKCRETLDSIRDKLSEYTHEEKMEMLQGRLTPLEWEDYNNIYKDYLDHRDFLLERVRQGKIDEDKIPQLLEYLKEEEKEYDELLFKYERRIIEDYHVVEKEPPQIDRSKYQHDEDTSYDEDARNRYNKENFGRLERMIVDAQEENLPLTKKEIHWLEAYFLDNYTPLKYRINHQYEALEEHIYDEYELEEWNRNFPYMLKHMDSAINKSEGLPQPTLLFHGGTVDPSLTVGSHGVWKNYISTTFQAEAMRRHNSSHSDYWEIYIYAPQGTKGIAGNVRRPTNSKGANGEITRMDMGLNQYNTEHEYLIGRNTGYTVIDIDYENHRQIVVLDDP